MSTGKVIAISVLVSVLTSTSGFFLLQTLTRQGVFKPPDVAAPLIVGLRLDQARQVVAAEGLRLMVSEQREDPTNPKDKVLSQVPLAGVTTRPGGVIQVVVSAGQGQVKVPDTRGLPLVTAVRVLTSADLVPGAVQREASAEVAKDQVISTSPAAGATVLKKSSVALTVSAGEAQAQVPKVVGASLSRARALLTAAGFTPGRVQVTYNEDYGGGRVLAQTPGAGTAAAKGTTVDLVVNEGD